MLTDKETLKIKTRVIKEIAEYFEELLLAKKLPDARAQNIVDFVKEKISPEFHERGFAEAVFEFCEEFPEFEFIEQKLRALRNEILEKVGKECLENLMETNTELWLKLNASLENLNEQKLNEWISTLPEDLKLTVFKKLLRA